MLLLVDHSLSRCKSERATGVLRADLVESGRSDLILRLNSRRAKLCPAAMRWAGPAVGAKEVGEHGSVPYVVVLTAPAPHPHGDERATVQLLTL